MPATAAARLKEIRDFALSLPGTQPKSPWPGHDDVAVNDKTFSTSACTTARSRSASSCR